MDKAEKERLIKRLTLRMLKFQLLAIYSQRYPRYESEESNKYDKLCVELLSDIRPAFHLLMLGHKLKKIQATKTNG
jgi:hypothetical protein